MDHRREKLAKWAQQCLPDAAAQKGRTHGELLQPVSGDASFRRYFRLCLADKSYLLVDAPPASEDCHAFVSIATKLHCAGLNAPEVLFVDYQQGFMLIEDFGDDLYLHKLSSQQSLLSDPDTLLAQRAKEQIDSLYLSLIRDLVKLQKDCDGSDLTPYSRQKLRDEMSLFQQWFCADLLDLNLDSSVCKLIEETLSMLEAAALSQPHVFVHRDYHSRNLMLLDELDVGRSHTGPGLIDFQDAVYGPYSYDLVSLLRDCYIVWPDTKVRQWSSAYLKLATSEGVISEIDIQQFEWDFDTMGLQRHLKVLGIFSRLYIRDKKSRYLSDIPVVMNYVLTVAHRLPELSEFCNWFEEVVVPTAATKLQEMNL